MYCRKCTSAMPGSPYTQSPRASAAKGTSRPESLGGRPARRACRETALGRPSHQVEAASSRSTRAPRSLLPGVAPSGRGCAHKGPSGSALQEPNRACCCCSRRRLAPGSMLHRQTETTKEQHDQLVRAQALPFGSRSKHRRAFATASPTSRPRCDAGHRNSPWRAPWRQCQVLFSWPFASGANRPSRTAKRAGRCAIFMR